MPHRLVPTIPDELLDRRNAGRLERWCVNRGFRPTLLDIENERRRRGMTGPPKVTRPPKRNGSAQRRGRRKEGKR